MTTYNFLTEIENRRPGDPCETFGAAPSAIDLQDRLDGWATRAIASASPAWDAARTTSLHASAAEEVAAASAAEEVFVDALVAAGATTVRRYESGDVEFEDDGHPDFRPFHEFECTSPDGRVIRVVYTWDPYALTLTLAAAFGPSGWPSNF